MELFMRKDVPEEMTWDLSAIYDTETALEADKKRVDELGRLLEEKYKGKLTDAQAISACLTETQELYEKAGLLANYAELAVSVDYYDAHNQALSESINTLIAEVLSRISFIESEILIGEICQLTEEI